MTGRIVRWKTPQHRARDVALKRRPKMSGIRNSFFTEPKVTCSKDNLTMLKLAVAFLGLAFLAAFFGFGAVYDFSWGWARLLFFIFTALALLSFVGVAYRWRAYLN